MLIILTCVCVLITTIFLYMKSKYTYWRKQNVLSPPTKLIFGNIWDALSMKKCLGEVYADIYSSFSGEPYVGCYKMLQPVLLIRDPELIRNILISDFHSFEANDISVNEQIDPLGGKKPFCLTGHRWKVTRTQLSPIFTTGKLKLIYPIMVDVSKRMINYLEKQCDSDEVTMNAKDLAEKFVLEVVSVSAFGIESKVFEDSDSELWKIGKGIIKPTFFHSLKTLCIFLFPSTINFLNIKIVPERAEDYLRNVMTSTLKFREENGIVRQDVLHMINEMRSKPTEYGFNDDDALSHSMSFFVDGLETSSITTSFILYELAINKDAQDKLRKEIDDTTEMYQGEIPYEALQEMCYLDYVVSETLRLHPPGMFLLKRCTQEYELKNSTGKIQLEQGTSVVIPIYALHKDPRYFEDPDKFDPNRFSDENKLKLYKGTYMPFGDGPRICLGQRFALLQIKVAVIAIIRKFYVNLNAKTISPIEIDPKCLLMLAKGGIWLDYTQRDN